MSEQQANAPPIYHLSHDQMHKIKNALGNLMMGLEVIKEYVPENQSSFFELARRQGVTMTTILVEVETKN